MKIYKVEKARKADVGIEVGESYFYCRPKKRRAGTDKVKKKTRVELETWIENYSKSFRGEFGNNMEDFNQRLQSLEDNDERDALLEDICNFLDEKQNSLDNMPDQLQENHVLNEQIEELEALRDEVESWEED